MFLSERHTEEASAARTKRKEKNKTALLHSTAGVYGASKVIYAGRAAVRVKNSKTKTMGKNSEFEKKFIP